MLTTRFTLVRIVLSFAIGTMLLRSASAAEVKIALPQVRTAYQTNETFVVAISRADAAGLKPGQLVATLSGTDGSKMKFAFEVPGGVPARVEFLHFNAALLRPGHYDLDIAADGASAKTTFDIASHVRRTSFRLIDWGNGSTTPEQQLALGEQTFGYNQVYTQAGGQFDARGDLVRAGVDVMGVCIMSGGHQMDLRGECDWSDPYVLAGGARRVTREAMASRTRGNVPGVNFYDEPGLTWETDPETGKTTPHYVPPQFRSYESSQGAPPPRYTKIDPSKPSDVDGWRQWATWKLSLMDAAWKDARFGVEQVRPDYLTATQSQYGWTAFTDGYYFNVSRSLPVTSGHGGYHDFFLGYFNPSYFLEFARARDQARPNWYLPTWYGNTTADEMRLEQYLSFQVGIQGLMTPPECEPTRKPPSAPAILETNKVMARLGTIFTVGAPFQPPPVAVLYSMSANIAYQTKDRDEFNYAHGNKHGQTLQFSYLAGKMLGQQFQPVVEEDVIDGTLAARHKAVIIGGIESLDPTVVGALEQFAASGGLVLTFASPVKINGAIDLGVAPKLPDEESPEYKALITAKNYPAMEKYQTVAKCAQGSKALAAAIKAQIDKAGIAPPLTYTGQGGGDPLLSVTRHAVGDVEYLFSVNATPDAASEKRNAMKAAEADVELSARAGAGVYDAMAGGATPPKQHVAFGPGAMRVFARTARPIGGVKVAAPVIHQDLTIASRPITLTIGAAVLDDKNGLLAGPIPLQIQVIDPLGATRYDLYRATGETGFTLDLPVAANDAAGKWTVVVTELLGNTKDQATFDYTPAPRNGAVAGTSRRALLLADDTDRIFRFVRTHQDVTIVPGSGADDAAAAARLTKTLAPWGVRCKTMNIADASKSRTLTADEGATWVGLDFAGKGAIKPGDANPPGLTGFAVQGPVILIGTPEDNAIIKFLADQRFLPYAPKSGEIPGANRGYVAWQRDGVGPRQESITAIAYDAAGMAEAVGSVYDAAAGLEPLTPWEMSVMNTIAPATQHR